MTAEDTKLASRHLRGTVAAELDHTTAAFGAEDVTVLKFHGIYQQDDRDTRRERTRAGEELDHSCMVRVGLPAGRLTAQQWLSLDRLAEAVGSDSLRVTTRQGIQFHGVVKPELRPLLAGIAAAELSTFAACGDVVRNVMASPAPFPGAVDDDLARWAERIARHFRPATTAYVEIWLDDEPAVSVEPTTEPIYGDAYLPRKFKIGLAGPGDNSVDVLTHDVGIVPVVEGDRIERFTLAIGGGMGRSHQRPDDTYARLGSWFADVDPEDLLATIEAIVTVHRDLGDRDDRKQARLKYVVDRLGLDAVRAEVERRLGRSLAPPTAHRFAVTDDHLGWHRGAEGTWFVGVHVPSGRVRDLPDRRYRSALRRIATDHGAEIRCTPQQNVLLCGIDDDSRARIDEVFAAHGVPQVERLTPLTRTAMACPALPTCGQALGEAERALPEVLDELEDLLAELGVADEPLQLRMTGCPNGCARPYVAELALVGRTKTAYDIYAGGSADGTRLNREVATSVRRRDLIDTLRPWLTRWAQQRHDAERFGDWFDRCVPAEADVEVVAV